MNNIRQRLKDLEARISTWQIDDECECKMVSGETRTFFSLQVLDPFLAGQVKSVTTRNGDIAYLLRAMNDERTIAITWNTTDEDGKRHMVRL